MMGIKARANGIRPLAALLAAPARRIGGKVIPMWRRLRPWTGARGLAELDDRLLRDIGLTRSEAHAATYGAFRPGEHSPAGGMRAASPSDAADSARVEGREIAPSGDENQPVPLRRRACPRPRKEWLR